MEEEDVVVPAVVACFAKVSGRPRCPSSGELSSMSDSKERDASSSSSSHSSLASEEEDRNLAMAFHSLVCLLVLSTPARTTHPQNDEARTVFSHTSDAGKKPGCGTVRNRDRIYVSRS